MRSLQDDLLASGGGDVLARWDGPFDGLHILLGYGAVTFDNSDEGRKLAQYAKGGSLSSFPKLDLPEAWKPPRIPRTFCGLWVQGLRAAV